MRFGVHNGKLVQIPGIGLASDHPSSAAAASGIAISLSDPLGVDEDYVFEGVPRSVLKRIDALDSSAKISEIEEAVSGIADENRRQFVFEVLALVAAGNEDGWKARIAYERGEIVDSEEVDPNKTIYVEDGDEIRGILIGSPEYERYIATLERNTAWHDWFLYLHPEQEKVVRKDYDGTAQLSGVSGSGKTCVLVRRAVRLAERSDARVLILTLNRSLAGLLTKLVNACASDEERERIEVLSFFDLAKNLLIELNPSSARMLEERTWKLAEHVDEVFREYFRCWLNNDDAMVLRPLQRQLTARGVCSENYLREEFDWIRSAVSQDHRSEYLAMDRVGRRVPILEDRRKDVLRALRGWESKMDHVGVVDYLALTNQLTTKIGSLDARYDHILIDEAQDFGTTELTLVRKLVAPGPNDIFLCGDIAQTVLPKHRSLSQAGLSTVSRDKIQQNYRNSREILRAAYQLLVNNLDEDLFDEDGLELLDPKFANFSGPAPLALFAENLEEELAFARTYAKTCQKAGVKSVCIAIAGFTARDVDAFARKCGVPSLNGLYDPKESPLVFSDLEQTKGYEFDTLIVVNCRKGVLPAIGAPEEEAFRQGCKLYVAMTRARRELILSFNEEASPWLSAVADTIAVADWASCEELDERFRVGIPELLPDFPEADVEETIGTLTGAEYLYTDYALGLSVEAQEKLDELVDGRGALSSTGRRARWKALSDLADDLGRSRRYDNMIGPKVSDELRASLSAALPEISLYPGVNTLRLQALSQA
jgi:superfamily I DNA/RNA helicase